MQKRTVLWFFWSSTALIVLVATVVMVRNSQPNLPANGPDDSSSNGFHSRRNVSLDSVAVNVVRPVRGLMDRLTVQTGSVHAMEIVKLRANVSGYLKTQTVDIGDRVRVVFEEQDGIWFPLFEKVA